MNFNKITFKNFMSYGNTPTVFNFNENKIISIMGKNAQGKSSIIESVYFVLTGKQYRNINKGDLVNRINKKNCLVELEFEHNNQIYLVKRGIKPNIFEIYRNDINKTQLDSKENLLDQTSHVNDYQNLLEKTLGLTPSVLKQTIIISSRFYTPFLELSAQLKRDFVENMLSITIFGNMIDLLKIEVTGLKQQELSISKDLDKINSNIDLTRDYIKRELERKEKNLDEIESKINESKINIEEIRKQIELTQAKVNELNSTKFKLESAIRAGDKLISNKAVIQNEIRTLQKDKRFYDNNSKCPECDQLIQLEHKELKLTECIESIKSKEERIQLLSEKISKVNEINSRLLKVNHAINKLNSDIIKGQSEISITNKEILNLQKTYNQNDSMDYESRLLKLEKERDSILIELNQVKKDKDISINMQTLLNEKGIKKFILDKYIPILNKSINGYLELLEAKYIIAFDSELNTKMTHRGNSNFDYGSFSSGEKSRCDLALLFAFMDIARKKNNHSSNLIMFDECFFDLDSDGILGLQKIFNLLKDKGYAIFVITHDEGVANICDEFLIVRKNKFSEIIKGEN